MVPVVGTFTLPATSASLTAPISAFTATDNIAVTGYIVTETSAQPLTSATGWSTAATIGYTFTTSGYKTLYAWAKDAAGNVSFPRSASFVIDAIVPVVDTFTIPATTASQVVPISAFTATDNVAVTGYMVTETPAQPLKNAAGWSTTATTSYMFNFTVPPSEIKTLYAWAKDAAGNVSLSRTAGFVIDTTIPVVDTFTIQATTASLTVPISAFTATDNLAVTGYMVTETWIHPQTNAAGWSTAATSSYTFTTSGDKILYAWAKDAAGNVSLSKWARIVVDTTLPTISAFSIPASSNSLSVSVNLTANDNFGIIAAYCLIETNNNAGCIWNPQKPTTYTFGTTGNKTLYAFVKDTIGNISDSRFANVLVPFFLNVTIFGNGSGSVHSSPMAGISCIKGSSDGCTGRFGNIDVILIASPVSTTSIFDGWTDACTTMQKDCVVNMNSDKIAVAAFTLAPKSKLGIVATTGFDTLQTAYSNAVSTIFALDGLFSGDWLLDNGKDIILTGGYLADYGPTRNGFTILNGKLTIKNGSLRVDGVKVRQ